MVLQEDPEFPALTLMKIPAALIVSTASSGRKKSEWPPKKKKKVAINTAIKLTLRKFTTAATFSADTAVTVSNSLGAKGDVRVVSLPSRKRKKTKKVQQ